MKIYREPFLDKLERKMGRYALRNLMTIIVIGTAAVWLLDTLVASRTGYYVSSWLTFNRALIVEELQLWRVITFVFVPNTWSLFSLAISLYFYWLIGNSLENEWGSFRFDLFYFCGVVGAIASGFITGYATTEYLHLSLFLAFALLYPDHQVLVFFLIPVKMKWLALIDAIGLVLIFIVSTWAERLALLFALLNVAIFFWKIVWRKIKNTHRRKKFQREARRKDEENYPFDL